MSDEESAARAVGELIEGGRLLVAQGFVQASGGNLSVRTGADRMLISATGTWLDRLRPDDFVDTTFAGRHAGPVPPSSEWLLHARVYRARPDAAAPRPHFPGPPSHGKPPTSTNRLFAAAEVLSVPSAPAVVNFSPS